MFKNLLESTTKVLIEDIFQPHSKDEKVDSLIKSFIKNSDGSYTIPFDITTEMFRLLKLKLKDIKIKEVQGYFDCSSSNLTSLEGTPEFVGGSFSCSNNRLTTLKFAPEKVGSTFSCSNNDLTSLKGAPKEVGGDFFCWGNDKKFTEEDVQKVCNVRGIISV